MPTRALNHLRRTFSLPERLGRQYWLLLPLVASQFLQRFQAVLDNRFITHLGSQALLIHNVQTNFALIGSALSTATATSCLIFWKRAEFRGRQGSLLTKHLALPLIAATLAAVFLAAGFPIWFNHFDIPPELRNGAATYFTLGLFGMIAQCLYGAINGMLIASDQRATSMVFAALMVAAKWANGHFAVDHVFVAGGSVLPAMYVIGSAGPILFALFGALGFQRLLRKIDGWSKVSLREIMPIWSSEFGIGLIRSLAPLVFTYQLARVQATTGFFVTYQLTLQLAYLFCLPYSSGVQIAVRDASAEASGASHARILGSNWLNLLFWTALVPTAVLLAIGSSAPVQILREVYGYVVPADHVPFLHIYFAACLVGQLGHIFVVKLRATRRNALVTKNFLIAEFGIQIALTQILLSLHLATPTAIGVVVTVYCLSYLLLNAYSASDRPARWNGVEFVGVTSP